MDQRLRRSREDGAFYLSLLSRRRPQLDRWTGRLLCGFLPTLPEFFPLREGASHCCMAVVAGACCCVWFLNENAEDAALLNSVGRCI